MADKICGSVFNIQKFCTNDGPGIRTTVFLKGCPLDCVWCHNPESKSRDTELSYNTGKCVMCKACAEACLRGAHQFKDGAHLLDRTLCTMCGVCAETCPTGALENIGRNLNAGEIIGEVLKDKPFYRDGGGITVSGGEPFYQFDFLMELLNLARENELNTCVETSGFTSAERIRKAAPLIDMFLYDLKLCDPDKHKNYTGVSNERILNNLFDIDAGGAKTILRCPIIPGINDNHKHFRGIADIAGRLSNLLRIELMVYHHLGESKALNTGRKNKLHKIEHISDETVHGWISELSSYTSIPVKRG